MNNKMPDIFDKLQQRGLIDANALLETTSDSSQQDNPWFLQALFGFSGLFASLFFVGFLTLLLFETRVFDSSVGLLLIGLGLSATGFTLFRNKHLRDNAFMSSLAFAVSVAGQAYVAFALLNGDLYQPVDVWLFLMLQCFMTLVMSNRVYRLLSAMITLCCLVYLLSFYQVPELSLGLLALVTIVAHLQRYELLQYLPIKWRTAGFNISKAIAYANAIMLLLFSVYIVAGEYSSNDFVSNTFSYNYYLAQGLLTLASLYAAYLILKRYSVNLLSKSGGLIICAIVVLGVISVYVSGLLATSLIIVIAMANSQRVLLGLGIFALVSYIFWYYYQLDTSLLVKSGSMLIIGIVMLLTRWLLISRYFADGKQRINAADNKERLS